MNAHIMRLFKKTDWAFVLCSFALTFHATSTALSLIDQSKITKVYKGGRDWFVYLEYAKEGLLSPILYGGLKPFGVPAFYSLFINPSLPLDQTVLELGAIQTIVSLICWITFFLTTLKFTDLQWFGKTALSFTMYLLFERFFRVNEVIASEPITLIATLLLCCTTMWLTMKTSQLTAILFLIASIFVIFCRFANSYSTAIILLVPLYLFWKNKVNTTRRLLGIVSGMVLVVSIASLAMAKQPLASPAELTYSKPHNWPGEVPNTSSIYFSEVFFKKVLTDPKAVEYFKSNGMPFKDSLMEWRDSTCCTRGWEWYSPDRNSSFDTYLWLNDNGTSTYVFYVMTTLPKHIESLTQDFITGLLQSKEAPSHDSLLKYPKLIFGSPYLLLFTVITLVASAVLLLSKNQTPKKPLAFFALSLFLMASIQAILLALVSRVPHVHAVPPNFLLSLSAIFLFALTFHSLEKKLLPFFGRHLAHPIKKLRHKALNPL